MRSDCCIGVMLLVLFGTFALVGVIITPIYYLREEAAFKAAHRLCTVSEIVYSNATCQYGNVVRDCFSAQIHVTYEQEGVTAPGVLEKTVDGDQMAVMLSAAKQYPMNSTRECMVYDPHKISLTVRGTHEGGHSTAGFVLLGIGAGPPLIFALLWLCVGVGSISADWMNEQCKKADNAPQTPPEAHDPEISPRRRRERKRSRSANSVVLETPQFESYEMMPV